MVIRLYRDNGRAPRAFGVSIDGKYVGRIRRCQNGKWSGELFRYVDGLAERAGTIEAYRTIREAIAALK